MQNTQCHCAMLGRMRCHQPPSTKLPGPPPWLGCCTLLQHGGDLRLPLIASVLSVSSYVLSEWVTSLQSNQIRSLLVTEAENRLLTSFYHRPYHVLRPLFHLSSRDVLVCDAQA